MGSTFYPNININPSLIAKKYREGKLKSTLKKELKEFEIVMMEIYMCEAGE